MEILDARNLRKLLIKSLETRVPINYKLALSIIIRHNNALVSNLKDTCHISEASRPTVIKYLNNDDEVLSLIDSISVRIDPRRS